MTEKKLRRYSAKMLFVYKVFEEDDPSLEMLYESRIVVCKAVSAQAALSWFKRLGVDLQWDGLNDEGRKCGTLFLGVQELLRMDDVASSEDEVWYDVFYAHSGSKETETPLDSDLNAIAHNE